MWGTYLVEVGCPCYRVIGRDRPNRAYGSDWTHGSNGASWWGNGFYGSDRSYRPNRSDGSNWGDGYYRCNRSDRGDRRYWTYWSYRSNRSNW